MLVLPLLQNIKKESARDNLEVPLAEENRCFSAHTVRILLNPSYKRPKGVEKADREGKNLSIGNIRIANS
jgi:hypothetical protein